MQTTAKTVLAIHLFLGMTAVAAGQPGSLPEVDERPALPFPPGIVPQSICGTTDELQDVELYDGTLGVTVAYVDQNQAATLQLQWENEATLAERLPDHALGNVAGARWCTGTLVAEALVLTAGHCFDEQKGSSGWLTPFKMSSSGQPEFAKPAALARLQKANFLYQINGETNQLRETMSFPVVELVEYRRQGLDYAFVKLGPNAAGKLPGAIFPVAEVLTRTPIVTEQLAVIQHPQGWPKKIEAGKVLKVDGSLVLYDDIDTYGGSSGSGVRDGQGKVVAVHTNGGCNTNGGNKGVTTAAIAEASDEL